MSAIWRVYRYLKFYKLEITLNVLFNFGAVLFNLGAFVLIVPFAELLFGLSQPPVVEPVFALNREAVTEWMVWHLYDLKTSIGVWGATASVAAVYLVCSLLYNLFRYLALYFLTPIRTGITQRLKNDIFHHLSLLPLGFYKERRHGDILSRMSNDLFDIEWSVVCSLQSLIKDPINIIVFTIALLFISPRLFLIFVLVSPVAVYLIGRIGKSLRVQSTEAAVETGQMTTTLDESLTAIRVIRAYGNEATATQKFRQQNQTLSRSLWRVAKRRELGSPLSEIIGTLILTLILVIGGLGALNGEFSASLFILFVILFARLIPPIQAIVKAYNSLQKGNAAAERVLEILDSPVESSPDGRGEHNDNPNEHLSLSATPTFNNKIELKDVCFSYINHSEEEQEQVLNHINLTIHKGETIALVGHSGAGKSTLVDLLVRFYKPTSGDILIDNQSAMTYRVNSWRKLFSVVSQIDTLFADTVAANIALGDPRPNIERIKSAAIIAHAHEFIEALPQGYDTVIGHRGHSLSGGQQARLSIARALYKEALVLILDEATAALDTESELAFQQALTGLADQITTIIIAHRLSTIRMADKIVVMDNGRIVQQGTHDELMSTEGTYRTLVLTQTAN